METKNNSGAIFKNDNKKSENHPDYKGKVNVNGKDMEVALWLKESAKGTKYFSASFSEPYVKTDEPQIRVTQLDADDLPF
jgi:uncharacterized protein (DUF736 family)